MSSVIDPKSFGERVVNFLRRRHPKKTAINVAAETGCTIAQVSKWLEGAANPNGWATAELFCAYGPEFLVAVSARAPRWFDPDEREKRQATLEARLHASLTDIQSLLDER